MPSYESFETIRDAQGLRLVIVQGMPSPWSQAAKTIFEVKGLSYRIAPYVPFSDNAAIAAWGGEDSAPIVAWNGDRPIHRWTDILFLAERLAPTPALIPADATERALMFGLSNELCGQLGFGWSRRLQLVAPAMESGSPPEGVARLSGKYGYNRADSEAASKRVAGILKALASQLAAQQAKGSEYLVGSALSALDLYWVAFSNLVAPMPKEKCPMSEDWRPGFEAISPEIRAALAPELLAHRDRIFARHFRSPMEF